MNALTGILYLNMYTKLCLHSAFPPNEHVDVSYFFLEYTRFST